MHHTPESYYKGGMMIERIDIFGRIDEDEV